MTFYIFSVRKCDILLLQSVIAWWYYVDMRKCDIDLKTLESAVRDMAAFAYRDRRQEDVNEAWSRIKEAKQEAGWIWSRAADYSLGEYVQPGLTITGLLLSFDLEPKDFEVFVDDRGDTYDLIHHQHVQWTKYAFDHDLVQEGTPPPGGTFIAGVEDGEWHEYKMNTKDATEFHGQYKTPTIYLGPNVEDAIAQMAWLLIQDNKAAADVTEWLVRYCGGITWARMNSYLDKQEFLGTLFDGQYRCHVNPESLKNFLKEQMRIGKQRRGIVWGDPTGYGFDSDRFATVDTPSGPMRSAFSGVKPSNPAAYSLEKGLEISVRKVSELLFVPESTIRDAITTGKIHPRIESTEKRPGYVRHKRKRYYFNKEQVEEASNYFTPHVRDRNLRRQIIGGYVEKRCPSGDYKKCYDAARQWIYRELRREPKPTLEELLERVEKMKKLEVKGEGF